MVKQSLHPGTLAGCGTIILGLATLSCDAGFEPVSEMLMDAGLEHAVLPWWGGDSTLSSTIIYPGELIVDQPCE